MDKKNPKKGWFQRTDHIFSTFESFMETGKRLFNIKRLYMYMLYSAFEGRVGLVDVGF